MGVENFNTKYSTAGQYKPSIKKNTEQTSTAEIPEKQRLSPAEMDVVFKLTNRNVLGSELKNAKFDPKKDQLGRIV